MVPSCGNSCHWGLYDRKVKLGRSVVSDFATLWTVVRQAPLSMEFSRHEYWSGQPFPSSGIKPRSPASWADSCHLSHHLFYKKEKQYYLFILCLLCAFMELKHHIMCFHVTALPYKWYLKQGWGICPSADKLKSELWFQSLLKELQITSLF